MMELLPITKTKREMRNISAIKKNLIVWIAGNSRLRLGREKLLV